MVRRNDRRGNCRRGFAHVDRSFPAVIPDCFRSDEWPFDDAVENARSTKRSRMTGRRFGERGRRDAVPAHFGSFAIAGAQSATSFSTALSYSAALPYSTAGQSGGELRDPAIPGRDIAVVPFDDHPRSTIPEDRIRRTSRLL
ncbi:MULTISPECIES: hypothetical protein [Brevibacterium]|uniref:hypothetical protein n=1 Tax=Brevibacterium TaxID=1696 RepID=UPI0011BD9FF2|nr:MULTISPECIES: hypothetical protein [Brevibacterium]